MFCRKCGGENHDQATSCAQCGANLQAMKGGPAGSDKPPNYLPHAIISTLCCCLPFGIVAIVYASQVDSKWIAGDYAGAQRSSDQAKQWFMIALVLGLIGNAIVVALQIMAALAAGNLPN